MAEAEEELLDYEEEEVEALLGTAQAEKDATAASPTTDLHEAAKGLKKTTLASVTRASVSEIPLCQAALLSDAPPASPRTLDTAARALEFQLRERVSHLEGELARRDAIAKKKRKALRSTVAQLTAERDSLQKRLGTRVEKFKAARQEAREQRTLALSQQAELQQLRQETSRPGLEHLEYTARLKIQAEQWEQRALNAEETARGVRDLADSSLALARHTTLFSPASLAYNQSPTPRALPYFALEEGEFEGDGDTPAFPARAHYAQAPTGPVPHRRRR